MSSQITIEDLRYIVSQQYKSKDATETYFNSLLRYANNITSLTGKDYYDTIYNTSDYIADEATRSTGIPSRHPINTEDMLYYDKTFRFKY